jgi:hypothetical protein
MGKCSVMDVYISPDPPDDFDDWDVIEWSDEDEADRQIDEMKEEGNWPWW